MIDRTGYGNSRHAHHIATTAGMSPPSSQRKFQAVLPRADGADSTGWSSETPNCTLRFSYPNPASRATAQATTTATLNSARA